jgi:hypothetical protein
MAVKISQSNLLIALLASVATVAVCVVLLRPVNEDKEVIYNLYAYIYQHVYTGVWLYVFSYICMCIHIYMYVYV